MERIVVTAKLPPGAEESARLLTSAGPPFDPARIGLTRHDVVGGGGLVVFAFEGDDVQRRLSALLNDSLRAGALAVWRRCSRSSPASRTRHTTGTRRRTR